MLPLWCTPSDSSQNQYEMVTQSSLSEMKDIGGAFVLVCVTKSDTAEDTIVCTSTYSPMKY